MDSPGANSDALSKPIPKIKNNTVKSFSSFLKYFFSYLGIDAT